MKNYVEVAYDIAEKPFGEYPLQLASYLIDRFHLPAGSRVLDNGCGRGEFLHAFSHFGMKTDGTDLSNYCPEAHIVDLNNGLLPFADETFEFVFSKSVMEHINNTEHYLAEMKRVCIRGGYVCILVPDWESQFKIFYNDPTHIHPYTVQSVDRLLRMMEFKEVQAEKFVQLPSVWEGGIMSVISRILRMMGPVSKIHRNKFFRFSRELMVLGSGRK